MFDLQTVDRLRRHTLMKLHQRLSTAMPSYAADALTEAGAVLGVSETDPLFSFAISHGLYDEAALRLIPDKHWGRIEIGRYKEDGRWWCQVGLEEDGEGSSRALAIADAATKLALVEEGML